MLSNQPCTGTKDRMKDLEKPLFNIHYLMFNILILIEQESPDEKFKPLHFFCEWRIFKLWIYPGRCL